MEKTKRNAIIKSIAVILSALMIVSVIGACAKDDDTPATTSAAAKTTASAAKTTVKASTAASASKTTAAAETEGAAATQEIAQGDVTEEIAEETEGETSEGDFAEDIKVTIGALVDPGTDLGGRTVTLGSWSASYWAEDSPTAEPEMVIWMRRIRAAEQKYNFKYETYMEPGNNSTNYKKNMIQQAVSGVILADMFRTASSYDFPSNVRNNIIVPIDEWVDFENPIYKANAYMYNASTWKGRRYGVNVWFRYACEFLQYNKELLDRAGQPDILDLVEQNQWNWSTFLDIAKATTVDYDGDGIVDQYGVAAHNSWYIFKYFLYSNGLTSGAEYDEKSQDVYLIIKTPAAVRTFQFVSDLAFVHKVYKQSSGTLGYGDYYKGKITMQVHNYGGVNRDALKAGMLTTRLAPMPMGPDATFYTNTNASQFYVISSVAQNKKEIAQIFAETMIVWNEDGTDWSDEVMEIRNKYFTPDWDWNSANPVRMYSTQRENELVYKMMYPYFKPDFTDGFTGLSSKMQSLIANPLLKGEMSVMQAIDSAESELTAIIDAQK
ncbi:MAG: extracellular solute-binding protein [Eubacteriales bacterium]|nr:extracellular solute-binding protein [Eubacteriales bacterium]